MHSDVLFQKILMRADLNRLPEEDPSLKDITCYLQDYLASVIAGWE